MSADHDIPESQLVIKLKVSSQRGGVGFDISRPKEPDETEEMAFINALKHYVALARTLDQMSEAEAEAMLAKARRLAQDTWAA